MVPTRPAKAKPALKEATLTTAQAAEFLGVTRQTLKNWRSKRVGPTYAKVGRDIFYSPQWLEQYLDSQIIVVIPRRKKRVA